MKRGDPRPQRGAGACVADRRKPCRDKQLQADLKRESKARRSIGQEPPEQVRYRERSTVEPAYGQQKDEYRGGT